MHQDALSPALRAAILAALAAYEQDATPAMTPPPLSFISTGSVETWRSYGRRAQMQVRFEGWRVLPSMPVGHLGWQRAPWRPQP